MIEEIRAKIWSGQKRISILAVILIILGAAVFFSIDAPQPGEPRYQGRALSSWLENFSSDAKTFEKDTNAVVQGEVAMRGMGTNAIPFLLKILSYEESPTRKWLRKTTRKLPFHLRLLEQDNTKSLEAAEAINAIGPGAESAFSPLTNLFLSGKSLTAGIALAGLGKNGVLFLISNLTNQNLVICNTTALSLGSSRSDFDIIVPALIKILNDGTSTARSVAAISLGSLHHSPDLVVPILLDNLNSSNQIVGSYVIMALSDYGTNAKAAIPLLIKMTNESDGIIREHAKKALGKISPTSSDKKSK